MRFLSRLSPWGRISPCDIFQEGICHFWFVPEISGTWLLVLVAAGPPPLPGTGRLLGNCFYGWELNLAPEQGEKACLERVGTLGLQLSLTRLITERSPAALPGCKLNKQYFLYIRPQGGQGEQCGLIAVISFGFNLCPLPPTSSPAPCLPLYPICHLLPCFKERQGEKCSVQIIF